MTSSASIDSSQTYVKDTVGGTFKTHKGRKISARRADRIAARRAVRRVNRIAARKGLLKIDVLPSDDKPVVMPKNVKDYTEFLNVLEGVTPEEDLEETSVPIAKINSRKAQRVAARKARAADAGRADRVAARKARKISARNGQIDVKPSCEEPQAMLKDAENVKNDIEFHKDIKGVTPEEDLEDTSVRIANMAINRGKGRGISAHRADRIAARRADRINARKADRMNGGRARRTRKINARNGQIDAVLSNEEPWAMLKDVKDKEHADPLKEIEGVTPDEKLNDSFLPVANISNNPFKGREINTRKAQRIAARRANACRADRIAARRARKINASNGQTDADLSNDEPGDEIRDKTEFVKEFEGVTAEEELKDAFLLLADMAINLGKGHEINTRKAQRIATRRTGRVNARRADRITSRRARKNHPDKGLVLDVRPSDEEPWLMLKDVKDNSDFDKELEGVKPEEDLGKALVRVANMIIDRKGRKISIRRAERIAARSAHRINGRKGGHKIDVHPSDEERGALLMEVKDHADLLKEFEGVIPAEDLTEHKRALYAALPSYHKENVKVQAPAAMKQDFDFEKLDSDGKAFGDSNAV